MGAIGATLMKVSIFEERNWVHRGSKSLPGGVRGDLNEMSTFNMGQSVDWGTNIWQEIGI